MVTLSCEATGGNFWWTLGMRKSLVAVLVLSLLFGFLFAVGGAGIYGSPFASVPANFPSQDMNHLLMALTILVGPLACRAALAFAGSFPSGVDSLGPGAIAVLCSGRLRTSPTYGRKCFWLRSGCR